MDETSWWEQEIDVPDSELAVPLPILMPPPCQVIGCDNGIHLAGCVYAEVDDIDG